MADKERLIDAELLTTNIAQIAKNCARSDVQKALIGRILFMIENMPAADVQPVKHGRWKLRCYGDYPYCSSCNNEPKGREITLFCPNCGSKQDLGGD